MVSVILNHAHEHPPSEAEMVKHLKSTIESYNNCTLILIFVTTARTT